MVRLECTTGGHNKFYEFHQTSNNGRHTVKGIYGAIGQTGNEIIIYDGDNEAEANRELEKKMRDKLKKGYIIVGNGKDTPAVDQKKE
jgi:predicted DNA-binding WGR domain protein